MFCMGQLFNFNIFKKQGMDTFSLSLLRYPVNEFTYRLIKLKDHSAGDFEKQKCCNPLKK